MADDLIKLPFTQEEYASRVERTRQLMDERGLELILLTEPENYHYLTGFQTGTPYYFMVLALPLKGEAAWIIRKTELSNANTLAKVSWVKHGHGVDDGEDPIKVLVAVLKDMGHEESRIGIEQDSIYFRVSYYQSLQRELPQAQLREGSGIVETLRRVKSPRELEYMRKAGEITGKALQAGIDAIQDEVTDTEIGSILLSAATQLGSELMSGGPFVTAGKRSFLAHSSWVGARINKGDVVNTEMAAVVQRYNTPCFRNTVVGQPSEELKRLYAASQAGLEAGLRGFKPGMTSHQADKLVRDAIAKAGFGEYFPVRAAYGIGLAFSPGWGENHVMSIRPNDHRALEPGMCFHLVPALYKEGVGAVCSSMPIEITEDGAKPLTHIEAKLFIR